MFMICSQFDFSPSCGASCEAGMETGMEHKVGARGEKLARRISGRRGRCLSSEFWKRGRRSSRRKGKENYFSRPCARKALISLEFGARNGRKWKGLEGVPRVRCAKTRVGCALISRPGAFLKDSGFDFIEAKKRRAWELAAARAAPALRRAMKPAQADRVDRSGRLHEEACIGQERSAGPPRRCGRSAGTPRRSRR